MLLAHPDIVAQIFRLKFRFLLSMFCSKIAEKVLLCFPFIAFESVISTNNPQPPKQTGSALQ